MPALLTCRHGDLTIRNLPNAVRDRLRLRAAQSGRSLEAEAREALVNLFRERPAPISGAEVRDRVRRVQAMVRQYIPAGASLVDEVIADRRWQAACDEAETAGLPRPARSDFDRNG